MKRSFFFCLACACALSACGGAASTGLLDGGGGHDGESGHDGSGRDGSPGEAGADQAAPDGGGGDAAESDSPSADAPGADTGVDAPFADSGGGPCKGGACEPGLTCCDGVCVNESNDPLHCGGCGARCPGVDSMCFDHHCQPPTCSPACAPDQQCCEIEGPGPSGLPMCIDGLTCPVGCPACA